MPRRLGNFFFYYYYCFFLGSLFTQFINPLDRAFTLVRSQRAEISIFLLPNRMIKSFRFSHYLCMFSPCGDQVKVVAHSLAVKLGLLQGSQDGVRQGARVARVDQQAVGTGGDPLS